MLSALKLFPTFKDLAVGDNLDFLIAGRNIALILLYYRIVKKYSKLLKDFKNSSLYFSVFVRFKYITRIPTHRSVVPNVFHETA